MERVIKIAILGPESSGKSTLAAELADHFHTSYAKEIAREYLDQQKGEYILEDLLKMARMQLEEEETKEQLANGFLFCDTNLLNFLIWSEVKFGRVDEQLKELWNPLSYQLTLLCYPDLPYEEDALREHPLEADQLHLFHLHEEYLKSSNSNYVVIKGIGKERLQNAIKAIDEQKSKSF